MKEGQLYAQALAEVNGLVPPEVELRPFPDEGLVQVLDDADSGVTFNVPRGTRAALLNADECFTGPTAAEAAGPYACRTKLLNGPRRGHVVRVDPRAIVLTP